MDPLISLDTLKIASRNFTKVHATTLPGELSARSMGTFCNVKSDDPMRPGFMSPRGLDFARKSAALALTRDKSAALQFAVRKWGHGSNVVSELKSAVAGGKTSDDSSALAGYGDSEPEFLEIVHSLSILGRAPALRRVPSGIPVLAQSTGSTAYWVGQAKAIPLGQTAFDRTRFRSLKVGALSVMSKELAEDGGDKAIALIRDDQVEVAVRLLDMSFIDPAFGGLANSSPASITHGLSPISSSHDLADDVEAALGEFTGSLLTAFWVMSPRLAAQAGLRAGGRGVAADLGARGGSLAGIPVLTSESAPMTSDGSLIALVDGAGIVMVEDGIELSSTADGMIEMDNAPTGATDTPTAATQHIVSLFQDDSVAVKMTYRANWVRAKAGSVVVIEGASYPAS